jgi:hypothetical protein
MLARTLIYGIYLCVWWGIKKIIMKIKYRTIGGPYIIAWLHQVYGNGKE